MLRRNITKFLKERQEEERRGRGGAPHMGIGESTPEVKNADEGQYIGAYGNVGDNINPIFDDNGRDEGKRLDVGGEQFELGSILDELRKKRNAKIAKDYLLDNEDDQSGGDRDDDSDDGELRVGKLHRERFKREAMEEHRDVRARANEHDVYIEGEPVPLTQLKLRDEGLAIENGEENIKWYLSDDVGKLDVFKVLPFAQGVVCTVPVNAIGRYIKAVCSIMVKDYKGKGYEATVGHAIDPITGEAIQSSKSVAGTVSATVGPVKLPRNWHLRYSELLLEPPFKLDPLSVDVHLGDKEYQHCILTASSTDLEIRGLPKDFPLAKTGKHFNLLLESTLVKFISDDPQPTLSMKISKNSSDRLLITSPDKPLSELLFVWGYVIVCQAKSANPESKLDTDELLQQWLERRRHHDLIT